MPGGPFLVGRIRINEKKISDIFLIGAVHANFGFLPTTGRVIEQKRFKHREFDGEQFRRFDEFFRDFLERPVRGPELER